MKIGPLRHRLTFERLTEVKDESDGSVSEQWLPAFHEMAELVSGKATEVFESQRRNALATWPQFAASQIYTFRMRYRPGIDSLKYRVEFNGQKYGIFPPVTNNRQTEMLIQTTWVSVHAD